MLTFILALLFSSSCHVEAQDVAWDYYKLAFGEPKLITTFGSQKVFEQTIVRLEEPKGRFVFSCYAYKDGQQLGKLSFRIHVTYVTTFSTIYQSDVTVKFS